MMLTTFFSLHFKPKRMLLSFRLLNGKFCICMKCCNETKEYFYYWYQSQSLGDANFQTRKPKNEEKQMWS